MATMMRPTRITEAREVENLEDRNIRLLLPRLRKPRQAAVVVDVSIFFINKHVQ